MKISVNSSKKLRHFESIFTLFFFSIILELRSFTKLASLRQKNVTLPRKTEKSVLEWRFFGETTHFREQKRSGHLRRLCDEVTLWRSDVSRWRYCGIVIPTRSFLIALAQFFYVCVYRALKRRKFTFVRVNLSDSIYLTQNPAGLRNFYQSTG